MSRDLLVSLGKCAPRRHWPAHLRRRRRPADRSTSGISWGSPRRRRTRSPSTRSTRRTAELLLRRWRRAHAARTRDEARGTEQQGAATTSARDFGGTPSHRMCEPFCKLCGLKTGANQGCSVWHVPCSSRPIRHSSDVPPAPCTSLGVNAVYRQRPSHRGCRRDRSLGSRISILGTAMRTDNEPANAQDLGDPVKRVDH